MKNLVTLVLVAGGALTGVPGHSIAEPLKTMDDVGAAIQACWKAPPDIQQASVTLSFSFKRDGALIGSPKPTAISVKGDEKARKVFVDAAIKAVQECAPLDFSPELAQGIGGTVYTMQFTSPGN